jgi:tryptophan halogenase
MKIVKKICVVGAGTAGLISAIILKKRLNVEIDVIYSKNIGIIGVGEGSTEHWREFMEFADIDHYEMVKETDATYKSGIMFNGWSDKSFLHSVGFPFDIKAGQYHHIYSYMIGNGIKPISPAVFWSNEIDRSFLNDSKGFPANQFHFNTNKLNDYLTKKAKQIGIGFIEDDIEDVQIGNCGDISMLQGKNRKYKYDFYIDCTGFKRLLIDKLGAKWNSYKKYLKMKQAIVFQTSDEENYNFWTEARAMDYGWMFRIPVWGRYGNGYIFDSDYITADQAHTELNKVFGRELDIGKHITFDPGALDNVWIKNCCAIGLSANFVEPLEASSIGTSIQQSFLLMHKIQMYNDDIIKKYNESVSSIMNNIRDFICLHYLTKKSNTDFWLDASKTELPDSLQSNLDLWRNRLPLNEDCRGISDYALFRIPNFIMLMEGLELFNREAIKKEYESLSLHIRRNAKEIILEHKMHESNVNTIQHKDFLKNIRQSFQ